VSLLAALVISGAISIKLAGPEPRPVYTQKAYLIAARFEAFMTVTFSALQRDAFPAKVWNDFVFSYA
jgi:hypothetical protein